MNQGWRIFFVTALLWSFSRGMVNAQTQGEIALSRASVQVQRKALVSMNMNLDEATAAKFWPLYNEYQEAYGPVEARATALMTDYASNWMNLSEEQAKYLLNTSFSIKQDQLKIRKSYAKKMVRALSPKIAARFFQIENKIDAITAADLADKVPLIH